MPFSLSKLSSVAGSDTLVSTLISVIKTLSSGLNHDNQVLTSWRQRPSSGVSSLEKG